MERAFIHGIEFGADIRARRIEMSLRDVPRLDASAARGVARQLGSWMSDNPGLWAILVDARGLGDVTPGWRSVLADWSIRHRNDMCIAWFGPSTSQRSMMRMFTLATGVRGRIFETEADARRFLREAVAPA